MKKKEKEHLKEDPFQLFIESALGFLKTYKNQIFAGVGAIALIIIIVVAVTYFRNASIDSENTLYSQAVEIQESEKLNIDQKIEKLAQLENKKGISASIKLSLAALFYQKGDMKKAQESLDQFSGSKFKLLTDKKQLLQAEIFNASGKTKEALDLLHKLFSDTKCEVAKDYILLKMSRIQVKTNERETAAANLKKLQDEYPTSMYRLDAQQLLDKIEKN